MPDIRAAGYTRVSTEEQAREGYGLDAQRSSIEAYCRMNGWTLTEIYIDAGVSGKSTKGRTALARMLAGAEARTFDRLVFWKLDRLSRSLRDVLDLSDRLEKAGVEIVSIQEGIDAGTATGRLYRNILGTLAEFERETITERIKEALAEKARQGELLGPLPLGYCRNADGEILVNEHADFVRDAFERYATGQYSLRQMATWARERGVRSTKGNPLDRMNIRKLLRNATYTGAVIRRDRGQHETSIQGGHQAIVDRVLFDVVQRELKRRRRDPSTNARRYGRTPYPLSTVAICGNCCAPMSGAAGGEHKRRYMRCSTAARRGRSACAQRMVPAELLERQLGAYVSGMELDPDVVAEILRQAQATRTMSVPDDSKRLQREIERWRRLFIAEEIDEARYLREVAPLKRALVDQVRPSDLLDLARAIAYLQDVGRGFLQSPPELQRRFVQTVFEGLVIDGAQLAEIRPRPEYKAMFTADRLARFGGDTGVVEWLPGQDSNLQPIG